MAIKNNLPKNKIKVLIVAAGEGKRANINYPKTLYKVRKIPIIIRILKKVRHIDKNPSIVVSPDGKEKITSCLKKYNFKSDILIQKKPKGMGDAILKFKKSKKFRYTKNILLIWGDLPFIYKNTINQLISYHMKNNCFFTIVSGVDTNPYTVILRDKQSKIKEILETRNKNINIKKGERDIGVFLFNLNLIKYLSKFKNYDYTDGKKEHNFLYIIKLLYKKNFIIGSSKITNKKEFISFNSIQDLEY